jgi:hypothetical protein
MSQPLAILRDRKSQREIGRITKRQGDFVFVKYGYGQTGSVFKTTLKDFETRFECVLEWQTGVKP